MSFLYDITIGLASNAIWAIGGYVIALFKKSINVDNLLHNLYITTN